MSALDDLRRTMAHLRAPEGCPWDRVQTHESLAECLIEECAEVLDALDRGDHEHLCEELGDLLLQVVFHAQIADEAGRFNLEDVAASINKKLVRRHPHVFGSATAQTPDAVVTTWEAVKAAESTDGPREKFEKLPPALPALLYARAVDKQLQKLGETGRSGDEAAIAELARDLDEARAGAALFRLAAACRRAKIDPESALRRHARNLAEAALRG